MTKEELRLKIEELGPWYQTINFDGIISRKSKISGIPLWKTIKSKYLPENMDGMRILDLGCNAGFISIQSAMLGAEVIGVERHDPYFKQAKFTKTFFEEKSKTPLNVKFIQSDISDVNLEEMGRFDMIYALAILYHIGKHKFGKYTDESLNEQKAVMEKLTNMTDQILVRTRNAKFNSVKYYGDIFNKFNFKATNVIVESPKRSLVLFRKND